MEDNLPARHMLYKYYSLLYLTGFYFFSSQILYQRSKPCLIKCLFRIYNQIIYDVDMVNVKEMLVMVTNTLPFVISDRFRGSVRADADVHLSGPLVCNLLPSEVQEHNRKGQDCHPVDMAARAVTG